MDINITGDLPKNEKEKGKSVRVMLNAVPPSFTVKSGVIFSDYNILDKGQVVIPNGENLDGLSFSTFFPGNSRKGEPWIRGKFISPETMIRYFKKWKRYGVPLHIVITGSPVNNHFYIDTFEYAPYGSYGDYNYSVNFIAAKKVSTSKVKSADASNKDSKRISKDKDSVYVVKAKDSLWKIALKYYKSGIKYKDIYAENIETIEKTAKQHVKKSSENGRWIFPGTKLNIP